MMHHETSRAAKVFSRVAGTSSQLLGQLGCQETGKGAKHAEAQHSDATEEQGKEAGRHGHSLVHLSRVLVPSEESTAGP